MDVEKELTPTKPVDNSSEVALSQRPLSPVLSTGKRGRLLPFGSKTRRKKTRVNLCAKYPVNSSKSDNICPQDTDKLFVDVKCLQKISSDNVEEKIKCIKRIEEQRKKFYDVLTSYNVNKSSGDANNSVMQCTEDFHFKIPHSPVRFKNKKTHKPCENITDIKSEEFYNQIKYFKNEGCENKQMSEGFKSASGKKIEISQNALNNARSIFGDEKLDNYTSNVSSFNEPDETQTFIKSSNTSQKSEDKKYFKQMPKEFRSASGKLIEISQNVLLNARNIFVDEKLDDCIVNVCSSSVPLDETKIIENMISIKSVQESLDKKEFKVSADGKTDDGVTNMYSTSEPKDPRQFVKNTETIKSGITFSQDSGISDTQMNYIVDNVEFALNEIGDGDKPKKADPSDAQKTLEQEIVELQALLKEDIPDLAKSEPSSSAKDKDRPKVNTLENKDIKNSAPIQAVEEANKKCGNILKVLNVVHKQIQDNLSNKITEFSGFTSSESDLSTDRENSMKEVVEDCVNKINEVDLLGFTKKEQQLLVCHFNKYLKHLEENKKIISDSTVNSKCSLRSQKTDINFDCSGDSVITLFKNRKRTHNKSSLPPRKRTKFSLSPNVVKEIQMNCESIDKEKYTEEWCKSHSPDYENSKSSSTEKSEVNFTDISENKFSATEGLYKRQSRRRSQRNISKTDTDSNIQLSSRNSKKTNNLLKELKNQTNTLENEIMNYGFKSASGKNIPVSKDSIVKAQKLFDSTDCDEKINEETTNPENVGFQSASGKAIKFSKESLKKAEKIFKAVSTDHELLAVGKDSFGSKSEENIKNQECSNFGFKAASGKNIKVSSKSLAKAQKLFDDTNTNVGFKSASGKDLQISKDALLTAQKLFENASNISSDDEDTLKNKKYEHKANKDTKKEIEEQIASDNPNFSSTSGGGFKCASGKGVNVSARVLQRAFKIFEQVCNENVPPTPPVSKKERASDVTDNNFSLKTEGGNDAVQMGFKSASGKNVIVSKEVLHKAQNIFIDMDAEAQSNSSDIQSESNIDSRKDSTNKEKCEFTTPRSNTSFLKAKRRLGVPSCKQINVSNEKLERAKLLFADTENFNTEISSSTPIRDTIQEYKNSALAVAVDIIDSFKNACTPAKAGDDSITKSAQSRICIQAETKGDISNWLTEMQEEYENLEKQLEIVKSKRDALVRQKSAFEVNKASDKGQVAGVLYTKKGESGRNTLKNFVNGKMPAENNHFYDDRIRNITPQNAVFVHFNVMNQSSINTSDGAVLIPNKQNLIGISEIEAAFHSMPGVHCNLLPDRWIKNHYKWIVWKLASYERSFPEQFKDCLNPENVIEQLKYRYDREIDRAQRSALHRILEKDDAVQKRMVLCVSNIYKVTSEAFEIELSDGWYSVRTLIDLPLCDQIRKGKLKVGTKIVTQGADLLNCEGCHPLQIPENVRLKINYNCTRRTAWDAKLGFHSYPGPLPIILKTIHVKGGIVGHIKVCIARLYPLRYMEKQDSHITWRNGKAEQKREQEWEQERLGKLEKVHSKFQEDYENQLQQEAKAERHSLPKISEVPNITCPKVLHDLLTHSNDPDSVMETLSSSQKALVMEYQKNYSMQQQQDFSTKLAKTLQESKLTQREVIPILRAVLVDALVDSEDATVLNIWRPTQEILELLKEGYLYSIYNVSPRNNVTLSSSSRTKYRQESTYPLENKKTSRQILPIAMTIQPFYKLFLNEFDTVGIIAKIRVDCTSQDLWLSDFMGRLLLVKVNDGPRQCLLFDGLERGDTVVVGNLILCESQNSFGLAIANHFTLVTKYPQNKAAREALECFRNELPNDLNGLLEECDQKIEMSITKMDFINSLTNRSYSKTLLAQTTSLSIGDILNDSSEEDAGLPSKLTAVDVAMSMIDTDKLYEK